MRLRIILIACAALACAALLLWPKWNALTKPYMQDSDVSPHSLVKSIQGVQPGSPLRQASVPSLGGQSDSYANHGTGRVSCDGQWSDLHRQASQATGSSYADFIRDCMSRKPQ
jgi:hypothetical protein